MRSIELDIQNRLTTDPQIDIDRTKAQLLLFRVISSLLNVEDCGTALSIKL